MNRESFLINTDTIAAEASPPGRGGVAILRISGPKTLEIIHALFNKSLAARSATYLPFKDQNGVVLDEGVAIYFPQPNSFTGEDVLELQGHGSPIVMDLLLQRVIALGARLAKPGEFSERAFLNGKIDLAQAEAIADLINASSQLAARSAMKSLQGCFSDAIYAVNELIIQLRMYIEAAIDFAEEEIDFLADQMITVKANEILNQLTQLIRNAKQGSLLREGISVVIVGAPNVGKSSLLNALSGKELAIVTDIPGTTRDVLRDVILLDGLPIHVIDTAGLRQAQDQVEQEGIRRAHLEMEKADLILQVVDASNPTPIQIMPSSEKPFILIRNKIDLINETVSLKTETQTIVSLSVKCDLGLDLLKQAIKSKVGFESNEDGVFTARRRHLEALDRAKNHAECALQRLTLDRAGELAAEELRLAHRALCEITGEFTSDDLLGRIFSSFCIGK